LERSRVPVSALATVSFERHLRVDDSPRLRVYAEAHGGATTAIRLLHYAGGADSLLLLWAGGGLSDSSVDGLGVGALGLSEQG
jgi:hypothetical protein